MLGALEALRSNVAYRGHFDSPNWPRLPQVVRKLELLGHGYERESVILWSGVLVKMPVFWAPVSVGDMSGSANA